MNMEDQIAETIDLSPEITPEPTPPKWYHKKPLKILALTIGSILAVLLVGLGLFYAIPYGPEIAMSRFHGADSLLLSENDRIIDTLKIKKEIQVLEQRLNRLTGQNPYLIINTTENRFYLYSGKELIRQGPCSTGSNTILVSDKREFTFKTPRGVHRVRLKAPNPVWTKPDWAFIEEGLPIPPYGHPSRYDRYTLGAYKLDIGDAYMIHGTLYQRLIGLPVTHGCIRLLDDDLEVVYKTLPIGAKVIIY
ncbi:MAG: L,D-transpeptidase [Bacteroidales bacterium]|nr:L,D-transpeptidase [Bacteroidales bacterium]MDD3871497.1 L,D-transpeptidase [Bacteroidales bacterium]